MNHKLLLLLLLALPLSGCPTGDDDDSAIHGDDDDDGVPQTYRFPSRLDDGSDSVAISGQVFRHVLISDMKSRIGGMTDRLDAGWFPEAGDVVGELDFYFAFDSTSAGSLDHGITTDPAPLQTTYDDISSSKNLVEKLAGNDAVGQHADWSTDMVGWTADGVTTPESLVRAWFAQLETQAIDWSNGDYPLDPAGAPVSAVYVTEDGTDLQQLIQKFLLGAVAFSQGADDYLDDDTDAKGLRSDHSAVEAGTNYTALEHAWDEGVGYFGMSRDYGLWTDAELAELAGKDSVDVDGSIDLLKEAVWGHAINAGKRDGCADCTAPTDLTKQAWDAFLAGRTYITSKDASLSDAEIGELVVFRDAALDAWEKAIAATVVHYINDTIADLDAWEAGTGDFGEVAKHFSEMKGFAMSFQFHRLSPMTGPQFAQLHGLLGQAPGLDDVPAYEADLLAARALLGAVYGFEEGNLAGW